MNDFAVQLRRILVDPSVQKAIQLSYKLFKVFLEQNDMKKSENMEKYNDIYYVIY